MIGDGGSSDSEALAARIIAVAIVAREGSAPVVAHHAGVHLFEARAALARAESEGIRVEDIEPDSEQFLSLTRHLTPSEAAAVHASVARHLLTSGVDRVGEAIDHARAASSVLPVGEIADLAHRSGKMNLAIGNYSNAEALFRFVEDVDPGGRSGNHAARLCDLALAVMGRGSVLEARDLLERAIDLAQIQDDAATAVRALVQFAHPADYWYAGDRRMTGLVSRVESMELDDDQRTLVMAVSAITEMRIPAVIEKRNQISWVTRASVAQPLAERALERSVGRPDEVRRLALHAWRSNHRGSSHLDRRRLISDEALDLAQRLRHADQQTEAALMVSVDALESGDRPRYDESLLVARWVAENDGNPLLLWRSNLALAGSAHLDGEVDRAQEHRANARELGARLDLPGWIGAELFFEMQYLADYGDESEVTHYLADEEWPVLDAPGARLGFALGHARFGDPDTAMRSLRRSLRGIDPESSLLCAVSLAARVLRILPDPRIASELVDRCLQFEDHMAVDSNGWWCAGPFALTLAELEYTSGNILEAHRYVASATVLALQLNDVRALARISALESEINEQIGEDESLFAASLGLTGREREVLALIVEGATNPMIARQLAYSMSTIRADTMSIYRKLEVPGRSAAIKRALELNIVGASTPIGNR